MIWPLSLRFQKCWFGAIVYHLYKRFITGEAKIVNVFLLFKHLKTERKSNREANKSQKKVRKNSRIEDTFSINYLRMIRKLKLVTAARRGMTDRMWAGNRTFDMLLPWQKEPKKTFSSKGSSVLCHLDDTQVLSYVINIKQNEILSLLNSLSYFLPR